jgi:hypothetical protein
MLADGTFQSELYTAPIHFRDVSGDWKRIDNTLVESGRPGFTAENEANAYELLIPSDAGSTPVRFQAGGHWISFEAMDADGAATVEGSVATISGFGPNTSLEYEATSQGMKETIVLDAPPAAEPSYAFEFGASEGLTPHLNKEGGIDITAQDGRRVFVVPPPFMLDSSGTEAGYSEAVTFELVRLDDRWVVTLIADPGWLADPARVYPIRVDPSVTTGPPTTDCWINEGAPAAAQCTPGFDYLHVGTSGTGNVRRSLLHFDVSNIPRNATLTAADINLYLDGSASTSTQSADYVARRITQDWTGSATWTHRTETQPWSSPGGDHIVNNNPGTALTGAGTGYRAFDATAMVDLWIHGEAPNHGSLLKQRVEGTNNILFFYSANSADAAKWPEMTISYEDVWDTETAPIGDESIIPEEDSEVTANVPPGGTFSDLDGEEAFRAMTTLPSAEWVACGVLDDRYRRVKDYERHIAHPRMVGSIARLYCGLKTNDTSKTPTEHAFGYRHILDKHSDDWTKLSSLVSRNWRDLAGWAIAGTLRGPSKVQNQSPNRFCYSRKFFYRENGVVRDTWYARIYLGETGRRIMTAFPAEVPCRGENIL